MKALSIKAGPVFSVALLLASAASAAVWYVDADNSAGPWDGESWDTAFKTIQEGVDAAHADAEATREVWVAEGLYGEARSNPTGSVALRADVPVYGGFGGIGVGETERSARDWETPPTTGPGQPQEVTGSNASQDPRSWVRSAASRSSAFF